MCAGLCAYHYLMTSLAIEVGKFTKSNLDLKPIFCSYKHEIIDI